MSVLFYFGHYTFSFCNIGFLACVSSEGIIAVVNNKYPLEYEVSQYYCNTSALHSWKLVCRWRLPSCFYDTPVEPSTLACKWRSAPCISGRRLGSGQLDDKARGTCFNFQPRAVVHGQGRQLFFSKTSLLQDILNE